jgi:hypothetical protein
VRDLDASARDEGYCFWWRREWDSNPRTPVKMLLEFQSSAFDRSAISPSLNVS